MFQFQPGWCMGRNTVKSWILLCSVDGWFAQAELVLQYMVYKIEFLCILGNELEQ